ncbi:dihydrolipoyllysine-residue acetyltransferase [Psittacicella gerlachiana]|uniref:Acetyltransferase component of pyruvate dehydrogenase complex n=1 Tax=Psittacicella gerlachiana TaxID=2028574 RepID=A0A3A1YD99_9GAMM|nr:dihydrolipoyllysine-residue acetyltransferase [Psittacicella gerlachiana]RIY35356.1 dihydrolipoyllysine-residue acetyltransferase [Psittacicella gerlachiana]
MAKQVQMPDIGTDEVNLVSLTIKVGDVITADQEIATVEGDKASMEIPAPEGGKVTEVFVKVGDKVQTGVPFYAVESATETAEAPKAEAAPAPAPAAAPVASAVEVINLPDIGNDEVNVASLKVKVGDEVKEDQDLLTVEGDKASMDVPSPKAGKIVEILIKEGDKVKTGTPAFKFEVAGSAPVAAPAPAQATPAPAAEAPKAAPAPATSGAAVKGLPQEQVEASATFAHASPLVRRHAREYGVNLDKVKATGPKGRVLPEDVLAYIKSAVEAVQTGKVTGGTSVGGLNLLPWPNVDFSKFGEVEVKEMGRIPKISGQNLHRNWVMIPHVTAFDWADVTDLEDFRKQQNALAAKRKLDVKITPLVFIMKAVARALAKYPKFNASLSADAAQMTFKKYINLGIAVDTPNGLVVPVIRDVDQKGIIELSQELAVISQKARAGKLTGADMSGGCFTISSLGGIGTSGFTPIVNAPEVAILGVSRSETRAVWNGSTFVPRLMLPLCLSFDHRAIDGADGARFITAVNEALSDLRTLIM